MHYNYLCKRIHDFTNTLSPLAIFSIHLLLGIGLQRWSSEGRQDLWFALESVLPEEIQLPRQPVFQLNFFLILFIFYNLFNHLTNN